MATPSPKVFVSHASEDKAKFVLPFAEALRKRGVDAWVDQWEIKPGDSLVQKIFDEGIGGASAVIIVLSHTSVAKRWVREELDSAVIARIQKGSRLIPIILDACDVPVALQHIVYINAESLDADGTAEKVSRILFDAPSKPPLGSPPGYAQTAAPLHIPGLQGSDEQVLWAIGEMYLEGGGESHVNFAKLLSRVEGLGFSEDMLLESLDMLESAFLIEGVHTIGRKYSMVRLRQSGQEAVLRAKYSDYSEIERRIAVCLVNAPRTNNEAIAKDLGTSILVVNHFLREFQARDLIKTSATLGGHVFVFDVSPRLKRALAG